MNQNFLFRLALILIAFYLFISLFPIVTESFFLLFGSLALFVILGNKVFGLIKSNKVFLFDIHGVYLKGDNQLEDFKEIPQTRKIVEKLRKGHKVSALTNMSPELFNLYNRKWELDKKFDKVFYSGKFGVKKPDPRFFKAVLNNLKAKPQNIVFVDDVKENVLAARRIGIKGIQFSNPQQLQNDFRRMGIA